MQVFTLPVAGWNAVPGGIVQMFNELRRPFAVQVMYAGEEPAGPIVSPAGAPRPGSTVPRFLILAITDDPTFNPGGQQAPADDTVADEPQPPSANGQEPPPVLPLRQPRNRLRERPGPTAEGP